jgi:hypothetical protein
LDKTRGEKTRFIRYEQIVNPGCRRTFVPGDLLSDLYGDKKGTKGNFGYLLRLTPSGIQIPGMVHPHSLRHPLFRRWFADDVIITCVRWYLRFKLSYRDLAELARELGVSVARARFYDGSYATSQSSRNAGKPTSGQSAIPGA